MKYRSKPSSGWSVITMRLHAMSHVNGSKQVSTGQRKLTTM